jgi:membrane-associated phospholipid phosphatase
MPSMHIAVTALYVFAARKTPLFVPAILFCGTIMIGSVHFGYHYLVDVLAAIVIAGLCWAVAGAWFDRNEVRGNHSTSGCCSRRHGGPHL